MVRLGDRLAALASMPAAQLAEAWGRVADGEPPAWPAPLLRLAIAYHIQAKRSGGLSARVARTLTQQGEAKDPRSSELLRPGARLVRDWNGRTISVEAVEHGFLWENRRYRSLSQVAREVTGAHWSGPRFFGIARHG